MNETIKPPTIQEMLRTLNQADDSDALFVIACAVNIYIESLVRIHNRRLLTGEDVKALFSISDLLLTERLRGEYQPPQRTAQLSAEEEQKLLNAVEEPLARRT